MDKLIIADAVRATEAGAIAAARLMGRGDRNGADQAAVTAIIQPGGSVRDEMAIEVADRHHMAMVFTGRRHFRH